MSSVETELAAVMVAARQGNARAYRDLLDRLTVHLKGHIRRLQSRMGSSGASELEDILQETLIAIHTRFHTYDPAYPVTAWVNAIARYKVVDHYRAVGDNSRRIPIEDVEAMLADPVGEHSLAARDVERLLAALPANLRGPIEDVKLQGYTVAESAARSGLSESAVKIGIHRGMKRLAAKLGIAARPVLGS